MYGNFISSLKEPFHCSSEMLDRKLTTPPPHIDTPRSQSPMLVPPKPQYTQQLPPFYDPKQVVYPCKPPHDYTDEEFEMLNHFEFLHALGFAEPPALPPYLNSNLLNDANSKNHRPVAAGGINEIYRYRINELNLMDKYSTMKPVRPVLKRSGSSNSSSSSSLRSSKNIRNSSTATPTRKALPKQLKKMEKSQVPHHVMLNHLITSNMNRDGYITSSSITRYHGKFITNIVYFSTDPPL